MLGNIMGIVGSTDPLFWIVLVGRFMVHMGELFTAHKDETEDAEGD